MKILLIRFSPVSDIILASPMMRCLRKRFPGAEIHFLTHNNNRHAVEFNPYINKLHVLAHSNELMLEELKPEEYDYVIDLENSELSSWTRNELGVKTYTTRKDSFWNRLFHAGHQLPVAESYFYALRTWDIKNDQAGPEYFISPGDETKREDIPTSHHAGFIGCVIAQEEGQWLDNHWETFCRLMDHPIILLGNKKDAERGKELSSVDPIKIYNACGKFSFNEMADLVKKSKLIITPSTALMQVACAYKRPVVWLSGGKRSSIPPYYGDLFISQRSTPIYLRCSVNDQPTTIVKQATTFL